MKIVVDTAENRPPKLYLRSGAETIPWSLGEGLLSKFCVYLVDLNYRLKTSRRLLDFGVDISEIG